MEQKANEGVMEITGEERERSSTQLRCNRCYSNIYFKKLLCYLPEMCRKLGKY